MESKSEFTDFKDDLKEFQNFSEFPVKRWNSFEELQDYVTEKPAEFEEFRSYIEETYQQLQTFEQFVKYSEDQVKFDGPPYTLSSKEAALETAEAAMIAGKTVWDDFKKFISEGNSVDLAIGIILGGGFSSIVSSAVRDLFSPIVGVIVGSTLSSSFFVLACPYLPNSTTVRGTIGVDCFWSDFNTIAIARDSGAITLNYGYFLQTLINFFIIALMLYAVVRGYMLLFQGKEAPKEIEPEKRDCPFCTKDILVEAKRCHHCKSYLEEESAAERFTRIKQQRETDDDSDDDDNLQKKKDLRLQAALLGNLMQSGNLSILSGKQDHGASRRPSMFSDLK